MRVSIRQYGKAFFSVHGALGGLSFIPTLIGAGMGDSARIPDYFYPPLGDVQPIALAGTIAFGLLSIYIVYVCCENSSSRLRPVAPIVLSFVCFLGFCILIGLDIRFVRVIPITNENTEVTVSVGYSRTDFVSSSKDLADLSDSELLHARGPWEPQIQKLWTLRSITFARIWLWAAYTFVLVCLVSVFSLVVYQDASSPVQSTE
jgi:hypothetical protein